MRSFLGRDILSLKDFSRDEFSRVFQVCDDLKPYARDRRIELTIRDGRIARYEMRDRIDAAGNIVGEDVADEVAPVAGQDIQLSIDLDVQQYAEQALQTELRNRRNLPTDLTGITQLGAQLKVQTETTADTIRLEGSGDNSAWTQITSRSGSTMRAL